MHIPMADIKEFSQVRSILKPRQDGMGKELSACQNPIQRVLNFGGYFHDLGIWTDWSTIPNERLSKCYARPDGSTQHWPAVDLAGLKRQSETCRDTSPTTDFIVESSSYS